MGWMERLRFKINLPSYIIDDTGLQEEIATWEEILRDEILVGSYSNTVTHTERAQHIQDLTTTSIHEDQKTSTA